MQVDPEFEHTKEAARRHVICNISMSAVPQPPAVYLEVTIPGVLARGSTRCLSFRKTVPRVKPEAAVSRNYSTRIGLPGMLALTPATLRVREVGT